mmetsp:Transcript_3030/g.9214  ORF Transcript_3030/g.9214 Transcript_3030/m.9214 type:complete len:992 (+) Transcript_3030:82-3057(+)
MVSASRVLWLARALGAGTTALVVTTRAPSRRMARAQRSMRMAAEAAPPQTLLDKVWSSHVVAMRDEKTAILYVDRHLVHEVTSPQAFEGLSLANRPVRRPDCTLCTVDHNVPTTSRKEFHGGAVSVESFLEDVASRTQVLALEENVEKFGLPYFGMKDARQGIVHVVGPEQGFTLPGTTIVCGDSHTATHGAFGSLAFGIGTSEVEHVLATQTILQQKPGSMLVEVSGELRPGVTSKDLVLFVIGQIGTAGGTGKAIEFAGDAVRALSMEARMSMSNMAIEAGARAGFVAPDETTFEYLKGRPMVPPENSEEWQRALEYWRSLRSDDGAAFDVVVKIKGSDVPPMVTWGTSPQHVVPIDGKCPANEEGSLDRAFEYMGLTPGQPLKDLPIDYVFIGSCTNGRIEDLRAAAKVIQESGGGKVPEHVQAIVVPGSGLVKLEAEAEGLDAVFAGAGFEWREPGCSMCLAMNPDKLLPQQRCASTSNRNFEGRQGNGGRTHLVSPQTAAACALTGALADVRDVLPEDSTSDADSSSSSSSSSTTTLAYLPRRFVSFFLCRRAGEKRRSLLGDCSSFLLLDWPPELFFVVVLAARDSSEVSLVSSSSSSSESRRTTAWAGFSRSPVRTTQRCDSERAETAFLAEGRSSSWSRSAKSGAPSTSMTTSLRSSCEAWQTVTQRPSTSAQTPASRSRKLRTSRLNSTPSTAACPTALATTAAAMGCVERVSTAAASLRVAVRSPGVSGCAPIHVSRTTWQRPAVSVPVLSHATTEALRHASKAAALFTMTCFFASWAIAAPVGTGAANAREHGHAATATTRALRSHTAGDPSRKKTGTAKRSTAVTKAKGPNTPATALPKSTVGDRVVWASAATASQSLLSFCEDDVHSARAKPSTATVPPLTASPLLLSFGTLSPDTLASSIHTLPSFTTPSHGTRSPALIEKTSPLENRKFFFFSRVLRAWEWTSSNVETRPIAAPSSCSATAKIATTNAASLTFRVT